MNDLNKNLMAIAFSHATLSDDPSTKVGAVISKYEKIVSWGHNHIATGIPYTMDMMKQRDWKYPRTIHAEAHAILNSRCRLHGHHIYVTHHPCEHCASLIIEAGIKRVYTHKVAPDLLIRWPGMKISADMFEEAGVERIFLDN